MFPLTCLNKKEGTNITSINLKISKSPLKFVFSVTSNELPNISQLTGPNIWGLWEFDVVEVFLQSRKNPHDRTNSYLEFQLSPKSQKFSLEIIKPRTQYLSPLDIKWSGKSKIKDTNWTSEFQFDDPRLNKTQELYFGAYAILGNKNRSYYSLDPKDSVIDFHRPDKFHNLSSYLL